MNFSCWELVGINLFFRGYDFTPNLTSIYHVMTPTYFTLTARRQGAKAWLHALAAFLPIQRQENALGINVGNGR